jgi:hypothetical protein
MWKKKITYATTMQSSIEEKPQPNFNKVIDNIEDELVVPAELVVSIT